MKKNFYLWHRRLGFMACFAAFLWCVSGFFHPIMSWTQPRPAAMFLEPTKVAVGDAPLSPAEAFTRNGIARFRTFHLVKFGDTTFYQVQTQGKPELTYIDTATGAALPNGDARYAEHLAREFLKDFQSPVASVRRLDDFDDNYKSINRLLPVYKVTFDRRDGMAAYIDTGGSRLSTLEHSLKRRLSWVFTTFHNFEFVGSNERLRIAVLILFALTTFGVAASGITVYGLFWKRFRARNVQADATPRGRFRKYHRSIGIAVSVAMLMFAASGAFHAFDKRKGSPFGKTAFPEGQFASGQFTRPLGPVIGRGATDVTVVRLDGTAHYRIARADRSVDFVNAMSGEPANDAAARYIRQLAVGYGGFGDVQIASLTPVTKFDGEYGFVNKRLPVVKVQFNDAKNTRFYIEPSSGALAARFADGARSIESYSFDILHKWRFLDPVIGKTARDVVMMLFVGASALVSAMGLILFLPWPRRRRASHATQTPNATPRPTTPATNLAFSETEH